MVGVISNSDGRADSLAAAVSVFRNAGASLVIHCGDVGGRHVLDALEGTRSAFVWGDRDKDRMGLLRYGHSVGVDCLGLMGDLELEGKRIAVLHGDDRKLLRRLLDEQQHDIILCGHEASIEDYTIGKTRVLNPGPLHGGKNPSAMLLDPATGKTNLVPL